MPYDSKYISEFSDVVKYLEAPIDASEHVNILHISR